MFFFRLVLCVFNFLMRFFCFWFVCDIFFLIWVVWGVFLLICCIRSDRLLFILFILGFCFLRMDNKVWKLENKVINLLINNNNNYFFL